MAESLIGERWEGNVVQQTPMVTAPGTFNGQLAFNWVWGRNFKICRWPLPGKEYYIYKTEFGH